MKNQNRIWIIIIIAALLIITAALFFIVRSLRRENEAATEDQWTAVSENESAVENPSGAANTGIPESTSGTENDSAADQEGFSSAESPAQDAASAKDPADNSSSGSGSETSVPMITPEAPANIPSGTDQPASHVQPSLIADTPASVYSYESMLSDLSLLYEAYSDRMTISSAGTSLDGRDIPCVTIGNEAAERHVIFQYTIHAREHMNTQLCIAQLRDCMAGYDSPVYNGLSFSDMFSSVCFHVIPMSNPDGVAISQTASIDCIRDESLKNTLRGCYSYDLGRGKASDETSYWRRWKANARGVDLNRNFDAGWDTFEGSEQPAADRYKGTAPASEPETQAILSLKDKYPAAACISYHSTGSVIYWDYGCSGSVLEADRALTNRVAQLTGYSPSSSVSSNQDSAGCSDYFVLTLGIPAVTIETGYGECPLSEGEFSSICEANRLVWAGIADLYRQ